MSLKTDGTNTPHYVLKSGNQPIYPTIEFDDPDTNFVCIYGFSDKPIYDQFVKNTTQALTPYPLVKGYLSNQIAEANSGETSGVRPRLVILDATDPEQPVLSAANMATVLLAHQEKAKQVAIEYELVFDPETASYQITNESETTPVAVMPYIVK